MESRSHHQGFPVFCNGLRVGFVSVCRGVSCSLSTTTNDFENGLWGHYKPPLHLSGLQMVRRVEIAPSTQQLARHPKCSSLFVYKSDGAHQACTSAHRAVSSIEKSRPVSLKRLSIREARSICKVNLQYGLLLRTMPQHMVSDTDTGKLAKHL